MRACLGAFGIFVALAGCKDQAATSAASSASAAMAASSAPTAPGLTAPGNDPAIVALAKKAIDSCGGSWKGASGFDAVCPDFTAFVANRVERGAQDATFVAFLEDTSPKVRLLGARGLAAWGEKYRSDRALAERLLSAAEQEKEEALTGILGFLVGQIFADKAGVIARISALATRDEGPTDLQMGLVSILLQSNRENAAAFDLTREVLERAKSPMVRNAAQSAFSAVYDPRSADVCKLWAQRREDAEETIAANAAARLTTGASWVGYSGLSWSSTSSFTVRENRCAAEVEPTLATIEARAKAGKIGNENWIFALRGVLRDDLEKTPAAQKKKALAVARLIAETRTNNAASRGSALRLAMQRDPDGKAFAKKLASDPDAYVRNVAAEAGPPKK